MRISDWSSDVCSSDLFIPVDGLTTALSYAYTDAKYRDYIDGSGRDLRGNKFPGVSRHVINLRADYAWDVGGGELSLSGGFIYRRQRPNHSVNSPGLTVSPVTTYYASSTELPGWNECFSSS